MLKKDGSKLGLCVTPFGVEIFVEAEVPEAALIETKSEPIETPLTKPRKPRDAKWKPPAVESPN